VKVAKGVDAGSNYSRQLYWYQPCIYAVTSESTAYKSAGYGAIHGDLVINEPAAYVTSLTDTAIGRLRRRLSSNVGEAQLAAPIAESKEIHRIIRQINTFGIDTVKALLALQKTKGKSVAKHAADAWLGFGFGIRPMLKDIESAANAILDYTTRADRHVRISGTADREYWSSVASNTKQEMIAYGMGIGFSSQTRHKQSVRLIAGIDLKLRSGSNYGVTDHLGLTISDIPSTLWELTPYSWAVDYFTTVGPWLDDVFFTNPGEVKYVYSCYKYQSETTSFPKLYPDPGFKASFSQRQPSVGKFVNFSRTQLAVLPTRSLRIKSADEIANYGVTKLLNLASVLASRRGPKL
jgi:hypothetical protein